MSHWLDLFRGGAALAVLFSHATALSFYGTEGSQSDLWLAWTSAIVSQLSRFGHEAVMIFFVLSGYLVGGPFLLRAAKGAPDYVDYTSARLSRMYTVLVPALLLGALLDWASLNYFDVGMFTEGRRYFFKGFSLDERLTATGFLCNLAFFEGIGCKSFGSNVSLWSLPFELFFYFIFLTVIASLRRPWLAIVGLAALAALAALGWLSGYPSQGKEYPAYFCVWMMGTCTFALNKNLTPWPLITAALIGAVAVRFASPRPLVNDVLLGFAFSILLVGIEKLDISCPAPRNIMRTTANFSFSLYAIHFPVVFIILCGAALQPGPATWISMLLLIVAISAAVAVSYGLYYLSERHTPSVRTWLKSRLVILSKSDARPL